MNKFTDFICDVAVVAGTAVGVGLISGKETQVFVGSALNVVIFFVVFCVIFYVFREFCRKNSCSSLTDVTQACFKRCFHAFSFVLTLCSFVCVVTCLAGVEQCLSDIMYVSKFPLYALLVATIATIVMLKGMSALKACNVASIIMSVGLIAALFTQRNDASGLTVAPKAYMPVAYALFTLTMSISVVCRLGSKASRNQNFVRSVASAIIICAALAATAYLGDFSRPLPTLSSIESPLLRVYSVITVALASISTIVGCAYPIAEQLDSVIRDRTVSAICVFALALTLSMFGFDFVVTYGYVFVAAVGVVLIVKMLISLSAANHASRL